MVAHLTQEDRVAQDFGDQPLEGLFDSRMLGQAFGNLIKNAVDHAADIADLADDRILALVEDGSVARVDLLSAERIQRRYG
ncbi:hypothetical protein ACC740_38250, partial [Rhizobium ruizarguesonis]